MTNHRPSRPKQSLPKRNSSSSSVDTDRKIGEKQRSYYSLNSLQNYIRKHGTPDRITFEGHIYTQDEYDLKGQYVTYGNKKTGTMLTVETSNRYGEKKFSDAKVTKDEAVGFRIGFPYEE